MALKITIAPNEKCIVNGAIIANSSNTNVHLSILNQATILRSKDIIRYQEVKSLANYIYYAIQCLYIFPDNKEWLLKELLKILSYYQKKYPQTTLLVTEIMVLLSKNKKYLALKKAKKLINCEQRVSNAKK